jgi:hypothetical protein
MPAQQRLERLAVTPYGKGREVFVGGLGIVVHAAPS